MLSSSRLFIMFCVWYWRYILAVEWSLYERWRSLLRVDSHPAINHPIMFLFSRLLRNSPFGSFMVVVIISNSKINNFFHDFFPKLEKKVKSPAQWIQISILTYWPSHLFHFSMLKYVANMSYIPFYKFMYAWGNLLVPAWQAFIFKHRVRGAFSTLMEYLVSMLAHFAFYSVLNVWII